MCNILRHKVINYLSIFRGANKTFAQCYRNESNVTLVFLMLFFQDLIEDPGYCDRGNYMEDNIYGRQRRGRKPLRYSNPL